MAATAEVVSVVTYDGSEADVLKLTGAGASTYVVTAQPYENGAPALVTVWMRAATAMRVRVDALGGVFALDVGTDWTRAVMQVAAPSGREIRISPLSDAALYLYRAMVESGATLPSDWVPAHEDMEAAIQETSMTVTQTAERWEATFAATEARIDGIESEQVSTVRRWMAFGSDFLTIGLSGSDLSVQITNESFTIFRGAAPKIRLDATGSATVRVGNYTIVDDGDGGLAIM